MDIQATKLDLIKKLLDTTEESVLDDVRKVLTKRQDFEYSLSDDDYKLISWYEVKQQARHTAAK